MMIETRDYIVVMNLTASILVHLELILRYQLNIIKDQNVLLEVLIIFFI